MVRLPHYTPLLLPSLGKLVDVAVFLLIGEACLIEVGDEVRRRA